MRKIRSIYLKATPKEKNQGLDWYLDARLYCKELSGFFKIPTIKIAGMLAALSPFTSWEQNKKDLLGLLEMEIYGTRSYKCTTFRGNVAKAYNILHEHATKTAILKELNGQKIKAFFCNIYDSRSNNVTIDRHITALLVGNWEKYCLTPNRYKAIEKAFQKQAAKLGIKPYQLQATNWIVYKRLLKDNKKIGVK